jgi:hypothetical protein
MAEKNVYKVWLLRDGAPVSDGFHIYRGEQLPEPDEVITVEVTLSPVPTTGPAETKSARVTRLEPGDQYPIHATELEPSEDIVKPQKDLLEQDRIWREADEPESDRDEL